MTAEETDWSCFVAVPAGDAFVEVRQAIRDALTASGVRELRSEDFSVGLPIQLLRRADLVIADVSDASPNTFFELGVAYASRKLVQLIAKRPLQFPVDLPGYQVIMYGAEEADKLRDFLKYWLRGTLESVTSRTHAGARSLQRITT